MILTRKKKGLNRGRIMKEDVKEKDAGWVVDSRPVRSAWKCRRQRKEASLLDGGGKW